MKKPRPKAVPSITFRKMTHCGEIYVTVTVDDQGLPFEVFVRFGRAGHCGAAIFDATSKLLSLGLRSGLDPLVAVKAPAGIGCFYGKRTCMNAVSEALREAMNGLSSNPMTEKKSGIVLILEDSRTGNTRSKGKYVSRRRKGCLNF